MSENSEPLDTSLRSVNITHHQPKQFSFAIETFDVPSP